jgi:hypothetical protein
VIHSVGVMPSRLPPKLPTTISTKATEIPIRMEIIAEIRARPIQSAEISQVCSIAAPLKMPARMPAIRKRFGAKRLQCVPYELILAGVKKYNPPCGGFTELHHRCE